MIVDLTILEIENLLMMDSHCKRFYNHEYARTAIAKIEKARKVYLSSFAEYSASNEGEKNATAGPLKKINGQWVPPIIKVECPFCNEWVFVYHAEATRVRCGHCDYSIPLKNTAQ